MAGQTRAVDLACLFCRIARGDVAATTAYRDAEVLAIEDVAPQAPTHLLVMPVRHVETLGELAASSDDAVLHSLLRVATALGCERGGDDGFRLVVNTGPHGGQTVGHLHLHVLAGRPLTWPPG